MFRSLNIMLSQKKKVIETTGCKIPCRYNEYKVVGEPQSGSTGKMGASEKCVP